MAETKSPLSVPVFTVPNIDLTKINPTGIGSNPEITKEYENLLAAQKQYADELEQRYAQPNFFKVAAGFAKPQLGGFTASLGSAFEALGEQRELQRAIAPTVAQMRAQIASGNIALTQGRTAAGVAEGARKGNRLLSPTETSQIAGLTGGPGTESAAGATAAGAEVSRLAQAMQSGQSYADLVAKFGKAFVDTHIPILINQTGLNAPAGFPGVSSSAPSASPAAGTTTTTTPTAGAAPDAPARIPGVPANMTASLPLAPSQAALTQTITSMQQERDKINGKLTEQSAQAVPIFEVASSLYKAASNPSLAPAFGVFEKGDVLGVIGKALESGSFPAVLSNMRQQIISARLGQDKQQRALSDLQVMEGVLADLQTKMQNGVINPTDVRTMFESAAVPGVKNSQDSFLRGVARIASDSLARYETKASFDKALSNPNFNILTWGSSPYFSRVQENAKKRAQQVISKPATAVMPDFMQRGLEGAYQYTEERPAAAPARQAGQPASAPRAGSASDFEAEARRRRLIP